MDSPWLMKVFPIGHLGVGIGLTYYLFALFLNRTEITVGSGKMEIRTLPVPWRGNKRVRVADVSQIYVSEKVRNNSNNGMSKRYELHMIDRKNKQTPLIKGIDDAQEALFLERRLEELLKLESKPVAGAYTG